MNLRSATYYTVKEAENDFAGLLIEEEAIIEDENDITTDSGDKTKDRFDLEAEDKFNPDINGDDVMTDEFMDID
jgi:hypothetical protein